MAPKLSAVSRRNGVLSFLNDWTKVLKEQRKYLLAICATSRCTESFIATTMLNVDTKCFGPNDPN